MMGKLVTFVFNAFLYETRVRSNFWHHFTRLGFSNEASGQGSTAMGNQTIASGDNSTSPEELLFMDSRAPLFAKKATISATILREASSWTKLEICGVSQA